ncbi:MAG TPA: PHP domain-containing protein, partial [Ardenticatenaceae bacterium]|nr:PHP domain-containing protein [Ardenticatenaceae bacterium]
WGTALQYFTGSQMHNIAIRELALRQGLSLSEYSFKRLEGGAELLHATEEGVYEALGMEWIPPELREGRGEIDAAREYSLPDLVTRAALRGDLHMHSTWSDGKATIAEMAAAARSLGYEYIVISDHSHSLSIAGGLDVERLGQQRIEILNVNSKYSDFRVLQGAEVEIKNDAALDFPDDVLEMLDVVIASLHSGLRRDRDEVTRRALAAIHNPHVDILAHPTGRLLGRREGADLDIDAVLRAAAETGTILEVNSQIDRLDLDPVHVQAALELGCLISIDSDAHSAEGLDVIEYGVWQARRGWATADDVINTRPLTDFLDYIHRLEDDEDDEED